MLTRSFGTGSNPVKNQTTSISYKGKTYAICSAEQLEYIRQTALDQAQFDAYENRKTLTDDDLKLAVAEKVANCGYATLDYVLGLMTPDERKEWEAKYRFSPFVKSMKG